MGNKLNIFSTYTPDPIIGTVKDVEKHLFDVEKIVKSKDDVKQLNDSLAVHNKDWGKSRVTGKQRTSTPGGFKTSASCDSVYARGHNIRDPKYVENKEHIDSEGLHKTYIDLGSLEKCYEDIFGDALREYNQKQKRTDRRIKNYLTHILKDKRRGSMKKNPNVDNSRKPVYEFIFEIGNRDQQIDRKLSIEILEKFVLEWMPEHYPNLKPVCVSLHADEFTYSTETGERIDSAPHIHFDFIPIAHRISEEEDEDFEKWKNELKEKEKAECMKLGKKFNEEAFKKRDWEFECAKRYGKAEQKSLPLQSSLSGACAEMGFRTQGPNTAQIQMERSIRQDLLDLVESYGIKVDRTVKENQEKKVSIDIYKAREDAKKIIKQSKELLKESKKTIAANQKKEKELEKREKAVEGLEAEKKAVKKREIEVSKHEEEIEPYKKRIDTLIQDELAVKIRKDAADKVDINQNRRAESLKVKENSLNLKESNLENKEKDLDTRKENLDALEDSLNNRENNLDRREFDLSDREKAVEKTEKQNAEDSKINKENAELNDRNLKAIEHKIESFESLEEKYIKYTSTVNTHEKISLDVSAIGKELKTELSEPSFTWREKIDLAVNNFTERCHKIAVKFKDAIQGFQNFLQGKTSQDFRKLADDMDKNNAHTFEEYEHKWNNQELNWQVEDRKKNLALKPLKKSYEVERD